MDTNFEQDMPDKIFKVWDTYTRQQKQFLMYMMAEHIDQTKAYTKAGYSEAGAKTNSYKLLKKLQTVWEWLEYLKAHKAASDGVISKNEMLREYTERFRDADCTTNDLIKLGKEIATICVYYPNDKQDMAKKELEMQDLVKTKDLPLDLRRQMAEFIRDAKKKAELNP